MTIINKKVIIRNKNLEDETWLVIDSFTSNIGDYQDLQSYYYLICVKEDTKPQKPKIVNISDVKVMYDDFKL